MSFIEKLKKHYSDTREICEFRYQASKTVLVLVSLLFFLSFFFVAAWYYRDFFSELLAPFYLSLLLSLNIYFYFFINNFLWKNFSFILKLLFIVVLFILFLILSLPLLYQGGLYWIYSDFVL